MSNAVLYLYTPPSAPEPKHDQAQQIVKCRTYADEIGLKVVGAYFDTHTRQALPEMLTNFLISRDEPCVLLVADPRVITDSISEFIDLARRLDDLGIELHTASMAIAADETATSEYEQCAGIKATYPVPDAMRYEYIPQPICESGRAPMQSPTPENHSRP